LSWTATLLRDAVRTGTRIFLEPERCEYVGPRLPYIYVPEEAEIAGVKRKLVKRELFRGNFVLTYRRV
jgi:hypothetical protein